MLKLFETAEKKEFVKSPCNFIFAGILLQYDCFCRLLQEGCDF